MNDCHRSVQLPPAIPEVERGAKVIPYDTRTDKVLWSEISAPKLSLWEKMTSVYAGKPGGTRCCLS
ncbi:hypothetical protein DSM110093_03412 (plasmid) [Sulfitobacter sp. DSM 110093]|nr:hypothetical protein DSM110093_03412 [Sulfitobacter sp. DSM 110093]